MAEAPAFDRLADYVAWWARETPEAEAAVCGGERLSYRLLAERIERQARAMVAAGVAPGARVACLAPPSIDFLTNFLAATSIGAIWIGLNPRYQREELAYVLDDSEPVLLFARAIVDGRDYGEDLSALAARRPGMRVVVFPEIERFEAAGQTVGADDLAARQEAAGGRQAAMIVYTSGSTGRPKGAILHQQGMAAFGRIQNRIWPLDPVKVLNYFPINHIGCVVDISLPALIAGGTIVFLEKFEPRESLRLMAAERCTLWASVPSVFQMQLDLPDFADFDLSPVQLAAWEGAPMGEPLIRRLVAVTPRLATNYGMTEATSAIAIEPPGDDIERLAQSVGFPTEGSEVRLWRADGGEAEPGDAGEVVVRSPLNMLGYWRRPDETAQVLDADGWLHTGDLGRFRPDGRLQIVGRLKEMYKSGGYNVYPLEVEAVLETCPGVSQTAVVGASDPLWGEVGVAFVVAAPSVNADTILAHARGHLAHYKIPKRFVFCADLPLLPIGKVDKARLRTLASAEGEIKA